MMGKLSAKLRSIEGGFISFWCPGCERYHMISVGPEHNGPTWSFGGNVESPTFAPSILVTYNGPDAGQDRAGHRAPPAVCHSFVRAGQIQFQGDCTHALKGQTVPLPDLSPDLD